ncbi:MAG TPA: hypothetical protein VK506_01130 [Conexibacter sp.]|nr:hypothetical protein [Conexibacter sp.]
MARFRDARGQAATEYIALIALVSVALALAAGITSGGVGGQVLAGLQRGLCHVAPTDCPRPEPPRADLAACPLEHRRHGEELAVTFAVVRLGTSGTLSATRMSDGRVTVTLAHGNDVEGDTGLGARLRLGSRHHGGGARAHAGVSWTSGRAWTFAGDAAARRFMDTYGRKATIGGQLLDGVRSRCSVLCDAIGWRPHEELPEPDEIFAEGGLTATLTASIGADDSVGVDATALLGRRERRDGARTWYLRLSSAATAALELTGSELTGGAAGDAVLSYEVDPEGRPRTLGVTLAGELHGRMDAARALGPARASLAAGGGAVVELEATLDLREPAVRGPAARLLAALTDQSSLTLVLQRARALGAVIARRAQIDRRTFAATHAATGIGAGAALGAKLDGGVERTIDGLRLLAAETRLPGLPFLPRDDCRPA